MTAVGGVVDVIDGTPPRPATWTVIVPPWPRACAGAPVPSRVSRMRLGATAFIRPPAETAVASVYQPPTSITTSTHPAPLVMVTRPAVPSLTMTRLAIVSPASKLTFDAVGRELPLGYALR